MAAPDKRKDGADLNFDDETIVDLPRAPASQPTMAMDVFLASQQAERLSAPDELIGRQLAGGKFTLEKLLGSGGAGKVYQARHRDLQKTVAIKLLHKGLQQDRGFARRFEREALAVSKLDHPNVLRVIDFGQEPKDEMLYIAMEFLTGRNLQAVLAEEGAQPFERIVDVMMQVCAALAVAHAQNIVHRDIKPANIILSPASDDDGNAIEMVKVCDFGLARVKRPGEEETRMGLIAGTPEYMSPEQARQGDLDERSDIYSCGVVMYEMATGRIPFSYENSPVKVLLDQLNREPEPPSEINPRVDRRLEKIILKAIRKLPEERYPTARDLRAALRGLRA